MNKTIDKLKAIQARQSKPKRPRHWAEEILQLKTREERKAALEQVPEDMRGMVEAHVKATFEKLKYRRRESKC